jgi:hypothetical protein
MQIRNSTPNQTRSTPSAWTTGMKIGSVIIIMLTWSTKMPRKISISIIAAITAHGARPGAGDRLRQAVRRAREREDLRERRRADDDEEDHRRDRDRSLQRREQDRHESAR